MYSYSTFLKENSFKDDVSITAGVYRNLTLINVAVIFIMAALVGLITMFVLMLLPAFINGFVDGFNSGVADGEKISAPAYIPVWVNLSLIFISSGYFIYRFAKAVLYSVKLTYFRFSNFNIKRPGLITALYLLVPSMLSQMVEPVLLYVSHTAPEHLMNAFYGMVTVTVSVSLAACVALFYLCFLPKFKNIEEKEGQIALEDFNFKKVTTILAFVLAMLGVVLSGIAILGAVAQVVTA